MSVRLSLCPLERVFFLAWGPMCSKSVIKSQHKVVFQIERIKFWGTFLCPKNFGLLGRKEGVGWPNPKVLGHFSPNFFVKYDKNKFRKKIAYGKVPQKFQNSWGWDVPRPESQGLQQTMDGFLLLRKEIELNEIRRVPSMLQIFLIT